METLNSIFKTYPYRLSLLRSGLRYKDLIDTLNLDLLPDPSTDTYNKGRYTEELYVSPNKSTAIYYFRDSSNHFESIGFKNRRDFVSFKTEYINIDETFKRKTMTRDQIKKIVKLTEAIVNKRLNLRRLNEGFFDIANMSAYYKDSDIKMFEKKLLGIAKSGGQRSFSATADITEFIMELSDENESGLKDWLRSNGLQLMYKSNGGIVITSSDFNNY